MAAQTVVWNKSEKSDIVVSAANIKAIKDAITAAKLASSTATVNDGDKVKFSGIGASGDTKYDNLKLTVAAAYKGTMEVVLTVDVDATKQIIFKMPVTVDYKMPVFTKTSGMWTEDDEVSLLINETKNGDKIQSISLERDVYKRQLFGELCDAVEFIPEQVKLFVDGFLFLLVAIGNSHPFIVFDDTNMQGGIVGVRDDFYNSQRGKLVYEPEGFSDRPVEDVAPVAITKQAFASFTQAVFILTVVVECIRIRCV